MRLGLVASLRIAWQYPHAVWSADPHGGVVLTQRDSPWALVALRRDDGKELWRVPGRFSWTHDRGRVVGFRYVSHGRGEERCLGARIERDTGKVLDEWSSDWSVLCFSADGESFIGVRRTGAESDSARAVGRVRLDPRQETLWETKLADRDMSLPVRGNSKWEGGRVYLVCGGRLVAMDESTGRTAWQAPLDATGESAGFAARRRVEVAQGSVIASSAGGLGLTAFDAWSGEIRWQQNIRGYRTTTAGRIYVAGYSGDSRMLWTLDVTTGAVVAESDVTGLLEKRGAGNRFVSHPALSGTHLFLADEHGVLTAFDRDKLVPVWSHRPTDILGYMSGVTPVIADDRLYIASFSMNARSAAQLYCYEPSEERKGRLRGGLEESPVPSVLELAITKRLTRQQLIHRLPYHGPGGDWTVLECRLGEATAFLAVRASKEASRKPFEGGAAALWVPAAIDGDRLLVLAGRVLGSRIRSRKALRPRTPTILNAVTLGSALGETGAGAGTWTHTKWAGEGGSPEFYVRWSEVEKRGMIVEKDEAYRKDLLRLFESLAVRK